MTNPTVSPSAPTPGTGALAQRIPMPGVAVFFFFASPVLLLFGGFLARVNAGVTFDWAVFQTMLGTVMFWVGVAALMSAIVIAAVRTIAQQHLDAVLTAQHDRGGPAA